MSQLCQANPTAVLFSECLAKWNKNEGKQIDHKKFYYVICLQNLLPASKVYWKCAVQTETHSGPAMPCFLEECNFELVKLIWIIADCRVGQQFQYFFDQSLKLEKLGRKIANGSWQNLLQVNFCVCCVIKQMLPWKCDVNLICKRKPWLLLCRFNQSKCSAHFSSNSITLKLNNATAWGTTTTAPAIIPSLYILIKSDYRTVCSHMCHHHRHSLEWLIYGADIEIVTGRKINCENILLICEFDFEHSRRAHSEIHK